MATERNRAPDPTRLLALLWRAVEAPPGPRHGPRQALSVDGIVAAAIRLADADGIDAVTMRRVAGELDVAPMTLYTYVPGRAELTDLMLDAVYGRMERTAPTGTGWRDRLEAVARDNRAMYRAHPWAAAPSPGRPPLGPGLMAKYEYELRALDGTGLTDVEMDSALTLVVEFVRSTAQAGAQAQAVRRDSALTDQQWWEANAPLLARVLDPDAYPTAVRVGAAAGAALGGAYSADHTFEFGLGRLLDGLGVLVGEGAGPPGTARGGSTRQR